MILLHIPVTNTMHIPRNIHWDKKEHTQYAQCAQHAICTKAKAIRPWYRCGAETCARLYQARRHIGRQPMNKSIRQNLWIKSPKSASIRYNPKNERQKLISKLSKAVKVKALGLQGFLRYWDCDYLVSGGKADQDKTLAAVSWKVKHDFLSD